MYIIMYVIMCVCMVVACCRLTSYHLKHASPATFIHSPLSRTEPLELKLIFSTTKMRGINTIAMFCSSKYILSGVKKDYPVFYR